MRCCCHRTGRRSRQSTRRAMPCRSLPTRYARRPHHRGQGMWRCIGSLGKRGPPRNAAAPGSGSGGGPGSGIGGVRGATNLPGCRAQLPIGICRIRPRPALRLASACLAWRHVLRFAHGLPPPAQHPLLPPRSHRLRGEWRGACASRGSVSAIGTD